MTTMGLWLSMLKPCSSLRYSITTARTSQRYNVSRPRPTIFSLSLLAVCLTDSFFRFLCFLLATPSRELYHYVRVHSAKHIPQYLLGGARLLHFLRQRVVPCCCFRTVRGTFSEQTSITETIPFHA